MKGRQYLNQIKYIDQDIDSRLIELENMRHNMIRSSQIKGVSVQEGHGNGTEKRYMHLLEICEEAEKKLDDLNRLKAECIRLINQLDNRVSVIILRQRYINMRSWSVIADQLNLTVRQTQNLHGVALKEFDIVYANRSKISLNFTKKA